jgi:hypothetical protein
MIIFKIANENKKMSSPEFDMLNLFVNGKSCFWNFGITAFGISAFLRKITVILGKIT